MVQVIGPCQQQKLPVRDTLGIVLEYRVKLTGLQQAQLTRKTERSLCSGWLIRHSDACALWHGDAG